MSAETTRPLHVRVAEALGWRSRGPSDMGDRGCGGTVFWVKPGDPLTGALSYCNVCAPDMAPPRYDTDWAATGPVIERYWVQLTSPAMTTPEAQGYIAKAESYRRWAEESVLWRADHEHDEAEGTGPTPLIAVCNLILALKEAGKL